MVPPAKDTNEEGTGKAVCDAMSERVKLVVLIRWSATRPLLHRHGYLSTLVLTCCASQTLITGCRGGDCQTQKEEPIRFDRLIRVKRPRRSCNDIYNYDRGDLFYNTDFVLESLVIYSARVTLGTRKRMIKGTKEKN